MQVFRSDVNVLRADTFKVTVKILTDNIDFYDTNIDVENSTAYLYLTENIYLKVFHDGSTFRINIYNNSNGYSGFAGSSNYFNLSLYKQNNCCILCLKNSGSQFNTYDYSEDIVIDTTNNGEKIAMMNSDFDCFDDGTSTKYSVYRAYTDRSSSTEITQILPMVNSVNGRQFDTLHQIAIRQKTECFADFNGEKWLFGYFVAVPCGDEITYTTYVTSDITLETTGGN